MSNNFIKFLLNKDKSFGGDLSTLSETHYNTFDDFKNAYDYAIRNNNKVIPSHSDRQFLFGFIEIKRRKEVVWHTCRLSMVTDRIKSKNGIL